MASPPLTYDNYKTLLLSAATVEDEKLSFSTTRVQRTVQTHDQFEFTRDNDTTYNIDTDINTLAVHSTDRTSTSTHPPRGRFRPSMTRDQWNSLSSDDKVIWDSFPPQTKATILGFKKPTPTPTPPVMKVNIYDSSAVDYFCILHTHSPTEEVPDNNTSEFFDFSMHHDILQLHLLPQI